MTEPLLVGREGDWPFAGHLRGHLGPVAWAGRVGAAAGPEVAWRAARAIGTALRAGGSPRADRRRALSILWARLDGVDREALGPAAGGDLVLLLVAADEEGTAVSGVGLAALWAAWGGRVEAWVQPPHPLLGPPGLPARRPGALTVPEAPRYLVGTEHTHPVDLAGLSFDAVRSRCGVGG